jgi:hypothetical protein
LRPSMRCSPRMLLELSTPLFCARRVFVCFRAHSVSCAARNRREAGASLATAPRTRALPAQAASRRSGSLLTRSTTQTRPDASSCPRTTGAEVGRAGCRRALLLGALVRLFLPSTTWPERRRVRDRLAYWQQVADSRQRALQRERQRADEAEEQVRALTLRIGQGPQLPDLPPPHVREFIDAMIIAGRGSRRVSTPCYWH